MLVGPVLLAGCAEQTVLNLSDMEQSLARAEWTLVSEADAWVTMPGATLTVERRFANISEQRILLPNKTSLAGDNFAHLRGVPKTDEDGLSLDYVLTWAGGLPGPFVASDLNVMRTRNDSAGTLIWSEWTDGAGTACVIAIRRMTIAVRLMPSGADSLDMLMRNCIRGEPEKALVPAGPGAVAFGAPARVAQGAAQRTLSPLAAPMP